MTQRLVEALTAVREATSSVVIDEKNAFAHAMEQGVSANLCEALVRLINPFPVLDRTGQRWRLLNPRLKDVINNDAVECR